MEDMSRSLSLSLSLQNQKYIELMRPSVEYLNRGSIGSTTFDNDCCGGPTAFGRK